MIQSRQLHMILPLLVGTTVLYGASAFAESRPRYETPARSEGRSTVRRGEAERGRESTRERNSETGSSRPPASVSERHRDGFGGRNRDTDPRDENRIDRRGGEGTRGEAREHGRDRNDGRHESPREGTSSHRGDWPNDRNSDSYRHERSSGHGQPYYANGRVSRIHRSGSGYRVWILGSPFPFFIPEAHFLRHHFRVGVSIGLGGYYNPLGYYDYCDDYDRYDRYGGYNQYGGYDRYSYGGYRDGGGSSRGELRGTVESVDRGRNTFVVRNEATGSFVTVVMRDRGERVRAGEFVELSGEWTRSGLFEAYDVDQVDDDEARR